MSSSKRDARAEKSLNKQASTLMKMYGNTGNLYRKHTAITKSVERQGKAHPVVTASGYTTNY
jgi:hypothetical protein